ncbi:MAG: efflux RND transporter periplasmic adaptor subunit [bacterium]|nr:efflux RND transporter periplasmic adaptor subunit [bacterium]
MKKVIIIAVVVLVFASIVASVVFKKSPSDAQVEAGKVLRKDLVARVNCSGTLQPKRKVDVSANTLGTILNLAVVEGQRVEQGDLLMEIDSSEFKAAVLALEATIRTAEADLQLAEASLEKADQDAQRSEKLQTKGLVSEEALAAARTMAKVEAARVQAARHRITQYEANLAKAHYDLEKVTLTAPMTGLVTRLNVEQGENVIMGTLNNPGTVLLTIADLGTMEAWVEVDETEVVKVELGQDAIITIDAFPEREFMGSVTEIGNSPVRTGTGSSTEAVDFEVKITLLETVPNIRPGLSAKAEIEVAKRPDALAIPLGAVTIRDWPLKEEDIRRFSGKQSEAQKRALEEHGFKTKSDEQENDENIKREETEGVFLLVDGFVKFVPVELGIAGDDDFEILDGLGENQTLVKGPFRILRELKDGAAVSIEDKSKKKTFLGFRVD